MIAVAECQPTPILPRCDVASDARPQIVLSRPRGCNASIEATRVFVLAVVGISVYCPQGCIPSHAGTPVRLDLSEIPAVAQTVLAIAAVAFALCLAAAASLPEENAIRPKWPFPSVPHPFR